MSLVTRGIRFLLVSALQIVLRLIFTLARLLLLPALLAVLRLLWALVSTSFTATVNSPRQYIDRRAGEWTKRFHELVQDRSHIHEVYLLCRILVGAIIVLGWIISILFTMEIIRVVFGFFI